jgi:two-component system sensor histidine kinase DevS
VASASPDRRDLLLEAGLALTSELSLSSLLRRIVKLACQLTGASYGALGVLGPDGGISRFITHGISASDRRRIGAPPEGRGVLGALLQPGPPLRLEDLGSDPRSLGFPPHHPPMRTFLGAPVVVRQTVFGSIYLTEKRGGQPFTADDQQSLEVLAGQAAVAIANATLYEQAMARQHWLAALQEVAQATLAGSEPSQVLGLVAVQSRELLGGGAALVVLTGGEGRPGPEVLAAAGAGARSLIRRLGGIPGDPVGKAILRGRRTVVRVPRRTRSGRGPETAPLTVLPFGERGPNRGALLALGPPGAPLPEDEVLEMLAALAAQSAVALGFQQSQRERQRLALLDERERIAKELHDGVIQSLFAVGMGLQAVAPAADEVTRQRLEQAVLELDQVIGDLRQYIFGLRPGILGSSRLAEALRRLGADLQERCGVRTVVEVEADVEARLGAQAGELVQLAREALSNVGRHARATSCRVQARAQPRSTLVTITDDGRGFAVRRARGRGQGLQNMRDRARGLGGRLAITSAPGQGTRLRLVVPHG